MDIPRNSLTSVLVVCLIGLATEAAFEPQSYLSDVFGQSIFGDFFLPHSRRTEWDGPRRGMKKKEKLFRPKKPIRNEKEDADRLNCDPDSKYRRLDGFCNNVKFPWWAGQGAPYPRLIPADYSDGVNEPRVASDGGPLPSARLLSVRVARNVSTRHPSFAVVAMMWGQIINHDVTSKLDTEGVREDCFCRQDPRRRPGDCFPIEIPEDDPFYTKFGNSCLIFVRSEPYLGVAGGPRFKQREHRNNNTGFIDASLVYGSHPLDAATLRTFRGGKLIVTRFRGDDLLPLQVDSLRECIERVEFLCFRAGDSRVNMLPPLTALHVVLMREHNRLCDILAYLNPHWDDETLYQEARRIIIAQEQHITYKEYLPVVLGHEVYEEWDLEPLDHGFFYGYDPKVDAGCFNEFAGAAYRFGHSMVPSLFKKSRSDHSILSMIPLGDEMQLSIPMFSPGPGPILIGASDQRTEIVDQFFSEQITNRLFEVNRTMGTGGDLFSINIQRGRDNGLAPYVEWREYCGLERPRKFRDLIGIMPSNSARDMKRYYRSVEDIDLFLGAVSEYPLPDALIGPTFACIISRQFRNLRFGDRYWYENGGQPGSFTLDQLEAIRRGSTLARLLCDNDEHIRTIQPDLMHVAPKIIYQDDSDECEPRIKSKRVPCHTLEELDLLPWKEGYKKKK